MLDLDGTRVKQHWLEAEPGLAQLFEHIEKIEDWTLDDAPEIGARLIRIGQMLAASDEAPRRLETADRSTLLFFLVYISTPRALRLLQWLDDEHDGMGGRIVSALLERGALPVKMGISHEALVETLVRRLQLLRNTPFFQSVFNAARLNVIERAIRDYSEEVGYA